MIRKYRDEYDDIFNMLHMTKQEREIIRKCFQNELKYAVIRYYFMATLFSIMTNIVTIGSVLVASFMSLEKITLIDNEIADGFFWAGWIVSIVVVIASKLMGGFDLQKKYVLDKIALEKFRSEGWRFASRIGKYNGKTTTECFKLFIDRVEKIKMHLLETSHGGNDNKSIWSSSTELNSTNTHLYGGGDKMYTQSAGLSPEIFSKFEAADLEINSSACSSVCGSAYNSIVEEDNIIDKSNDDIDTGN